MLSITSIRVNPMPILYSDYASNISPTYRVVITSFT